MKGKIFLVMCIMLFGVNAYAGAQKSDKNVIFYASFDDGTDANFSGSSDIKVVEITGEVERKTGYKGKKGLYLAENSSIQYSANEFNPEIGSLSFWINPEWTEKDNVRFTFFTCFFASAYSQNFGFYKAYVNEDRFLQYRIIGAEESKVNKQDRNSLPANEWSSIVLTWNNTVGMKLYVNGKLSSFIDTGWKIFEQANEKKFTTKL